MVGYSAWHDFGIRNYLVKTSLLKLIVLYWALEYVNYGKYFRVGIYQYFINPKQWIKILILSGKICFYVYVMFFSGKDSNTFIRILKWYKNWTFPFAPPQLVFLLIYEQRGTLTVASCLTLRPANRSSTHRDLKRVTGRVPKLFSLESQP